MSFEQICRRHEEDAEHIMYCTTPPIYQDCHADRDKLIAMVKECNLQEDEEILVYELSQMRKRNEELEAQIADNNKLILILSETIDGFKTGFNRVEAQIECVKKYGEKLSEVNAENTRCKKLISKFREERLSFVINEKDLQDKLDAIGETQVMSVEFWGRNQRVVFLDDLIEASGIEEWKENNSIMNEAS